MKTKISILVASIIIGTSIIPLTLDLPFNPEIMVSMLFGVVLTVHIFWKEINNT